MYLEEYEEKSKERSSRKREKEKEKAEQKMEMKIMSTVLTHTLPQNKQTQIKPPADDRLDKILLSQSVDGFWTIKDELCILIRIESSIIKTSTPKGVSESQWFTAVIIAFLEAIYSAYKDEWELIVEKSLLWLNKGGAPSDLIAQAKIFCSANLKP